MRTLHAAPLALLLAAACAKADRPAADSSAAATTPSPPAAATPATLALSDVAGRWAINVTPIDGGDTTSTTTVLTATADTTGWLQTSPGRTPVPLHVRADGDSIVGTAGPYESFRRKGMMVRTSSVWRLQGGQLVGTLVGHYQTGGRDSVVHFRVRGTRAP